MTKTQIKRHINKIIEMLNEAQEELDTLAYDVEETRDGIEPYDHRDELTEAQEDRISWLDETLDTITEQADALTELISNLEYID